MKKVLLLFLGVGIISIACAQQTILSVIAPAGNSSEINSISLDWTLGELAVLPLQTPDGMMTQGFHQPMLIVEKVIKTPDNLWKDQLDITVRPNPTSGSLFIKVHSRLKESTELSLKTFEGAQLQSAKISFPEEEFEWDMNNYPAGIYLLILQSVNGEIIQSVKITKI